VPQEATELHCFHLEHRKSEPEFLSVEGFTFHGSTPIRLRAVYLIFDLTTVLFEALKRSPHRPEESFGIVGIVPALRQRLDKLSLPL
jgi:hypothetical protein